MLQLHLDGCQLTERLWAGPWMRPMWVLNHLNGGDHFHLDNCVLEPSSPVAL